VRASTVKSTTAHHQEALAMSDRPPIPYDFLPQVPGLTVTSDDFVEGATMPNTVLADVMGMTGDNLSPHLRWSGAPADTGSFAVTCFDPDAPTASGFWHWVLFDLPPTVTELPRGAGSGEMTGLPSGAVHARNDMGSPAYVGPAPPDGHGDHRYLFAVHALGVPKLGLDSTATPALVGFNLTFNALARGLLVGIFGR
jgi:Raf kinase inhibitor-like YbhB/YbcL family protein